MNNNDHTNNTEEKKEQIELLSCALEGGCSAKIPPDLLEKTLAPIMKIKSDSNLLSDVDIGDDAGVYKISDDNALIFTVDYFPPVISNPYIFGQIAACNSISDIYAMGGDPKLALNINMFPKDNSLNILADILKGGQDKAAEAGVLIVGGHTITDASVKYGMAVVGFADPNKITKNSEAKEDDIIILTKELGTGACLAAMRQGLIKEKHIEDVFLSMQTLNRKACKIMNKYNVKCATDITGFGLIGHAYKMAMASNVTIELQSSALPMFKKSYEVLDMGCIPGAAFTNMRYVGSNILTDNNVDYNLKMLSFDPQTSGGLFICVNKDNAENMLADLWREGINCASIIGKVHKRRNEYIHLIK